MIVVDMHVVAQVGGETGQRKTVKEESTHANNVQESQDNAADSVRPDECIGCAESTVSVAREMNQ